MTTYKTNDLFGIPDELNKPATTAKQHKSVKASTASVVDSTARLPGQGFLPGLSRRGRPRLAKPISAVERTAEHRRKRIAKGAKRVEIILDKDVSQALDRLADHHQEPRSDVIATLIRKAALRLKV
ncbi:MAG: hypothetical protein NWQ00_03005 [Burkholderiaceae bacterium]|jgi:hypothetical protein|nr:hypothetical protein [Burkholderiaceae bacterium]MDP4969398.1 hypothetical protein [Burkholderiaceae bacterium]MDP5111387.1 hypothetical protein [Burkholderiaceae bacterium]